MINKSYRIYIFDLARCTKDAIPFRAIENIKDGTIVSGKYEGK